MLIVFGIFAALIAVGRVKGFLADPGQGGEEDGFEPFLGESYSGDSVGHVLYGDSDSDNPAHPWSPLYDDEEDK